MLWKSVCFSMCAGNAYWCHLSAKSLAISTNGSKRSESSRRRRRDFSERRTTYPRSRCRRASASGAGAQACRYDLARFVTRGLAGRSPSRGNPQIKQPELPIGSFARLSVANLDAGPVPNPSIPIPNGGASGPVACWLNNVGRSGRYIDGSWAGYRGSKQRTHGQAADNAGRYLATPCDRSPRCTRQTKAACDQQAD